MNILVALKFACSLNTLPSRGNLDEYTLILHTERLVKGHEFLGLLLGSFFVEREASVYLGGHTAGNNLQDLLAELDQLRVGEKAPRSAETCVT